jgi:Ca2+-transporting ATPase
VAGLLATDPVGGLGGEEPSRRLHEFGPNQLEEDEGPSRLQLLARQFASALVLTLIVAAVIAGALLGDWVDASVILAIVVLNAAIGYSQESKAAGAARGLRRLAAPFATVVRDGFEVRIKTVEIVPGDVIQMGAGDRVFADGRIIEATHFGVDESELTGESVPVDKDIDPVPETALLGDRTSMVFSGTMVTTGHASALVTATGSETEIGQIAGLLSTENPPTPLEKELGKVGRRLGLLAVSVAVIVFVIGLAQGKPTESMFLLAVALAVAAIPEGLPAVVGITLGRGVQGMARRNAIVRRLPAVEALGAVTVICSDKTGTLTKNEISVQEAEMAALYVDPSAPPDDPRIDRFALIATLCNDARMSGDAWLGDPTEIALVRSVSHLVDVDALRSRYERVDEIPFDAKRRRMSTMHPFEGGAFIAVKGAPEVVIPMCRQFEIHDGIETLDPDRMSSALSAAESMASRGLRTLALAYRIEEEMPERLENTADDLVLVGLVGMRDELRPDAKTSIEEAGGAGVTVVMITGDHEVTARAIAGDLELLDGRHVMSGQDLAASDEPTLEREIDTIGAFARVDPVDKVKIVHAWQGRGEIVAMTGDGINDAPALKAADIGVSMGSGTDVAREASDIVLADNSFATIVTAIREGRTIFANLRKVIAFLLAANVSEVVVVFSGFLLFGALGDPILATQLLWINLVTDGLPALALGFDPAEPGVMQRPPERKRSLLGWESQLRLLARGTLLAIAVMGAFAFGIGQDYPWEQTRTLAFTTLVLIQMTYVYALRVLGSGWRIGLGSNRLVHGAVAISVALQVLVVTTTIGNDLFQTIPLSTSDWVVAGALALAGALAVLVAGFFVPGMRFRSSDGA